MNAFQKIVNRLLRQFQLANGRSPMNAGEMMKIQNEAVNILNKTKGAPDITLPKKPPFQGFTPKLIQGGKSKQGIGELIESGEVTMGTAPKTKLKPVGTDDVEVQKDVIKEEWIADKKRQNKEAIARFKEKNKTVEDFRDEGDWDPSGMAEGGIAPLVGQPTYAADFYANRRPYANGGGLEQLIQMYMEEGLSYEEALQAAQSSSNLNMDMLSKADGGRAMFHGGGSVGRPPVTSGIATQFQGQQMGVSMGMGPGPTIMDREQQAMGQNPYMTEQDEPQPNTQAQGIMGPGPRAKMAGGGMGRRAFLKLMGGLTALPFIGKGIQKAAPKAIPKVTETIARTPEGIPTYAYDLIEVVKAKGTKEIMEGIYKRNPPSTKYSYKGVDVVEDGMGNTQVSKNMEETKSWNTDDDVIIEDVVDREIGFEIRPQFDEVMDESGATFYKDIDGKKVYEQKIPDEYTESTAYMQGDPDGGIDVSEITEVIDDADHFELRKIADEGSFLTQKRTRKASGGLAHMLGE